MKKTHENCSSAEIGFMEPELTGLSTSGENFIESVSYVTPCTIIS